MANDVGRTQKYWVAIGASAGGLEALRELVRNLDLNNGAIYVILQHMSPQHRSLLTELIGRETGLPVYEIVDGTIPTPDTIYIAPPNSDVVVRAGRLRLQAPSSEPAAPKPSVDRFFLSLAETMGDRAIGIILSGTGSDGAYGVQAIRAAGGITIAQSEATAKYNGMPLAATDTGCVDLVLAPEQIGARFDRIIKMPRNLEVVDDEQPRDSLSGLFQMLQVRTGVDFREYKPSTVRRRIERRMTALEIDGLTAYTDHVRENPDEIKMLFRDMMISVTSFFRNPEEFANLKRHVEQDLANRRNEGLRVWVPGCASGEEAYSLAILLTEFLGGLAALDDTPLQIFATDIDADALAVARRGVYPDAIEADVPPELLDAYFNPTEGGYQVSQALRERIVFTPHNLCQDPPFSSIDLISCRNLLIYFSNKLQAKVFARLHYALKPSGLMFLGKSESISGAEALFKPAGDNGQIFRRRAHPDGNVATPTYHLGTGRIGYDRQYRKPERQESEPFGAMFHALVRSMGPNALLVTADMHIHRVYGNIDRYLSLPEGQMRGATISMLREDLRHELRTLISVALRNGKSRSGLERRTEGGNPRGRLRMEVHPIGVADRSDDMALVVFREWEEREVQPAPSGGETNGSNARIGELELELTGVRESLQQTVEELETANEELQSLNEELQSANEELQSTNEELETTNEELQSTNEELITVNEELQINSHELVLINQELDSVLSNIAAPVLVVDPRLHIVQCSQSARVMFQIAPGVAKPHLSQLSLPDGFPQLSKFMAEVIQTGTRADAEIEAAGFRGSVVAAPYFNPKGELVGATAIVHEISDPRARDLESLLEHLPVLVWQKDGNGKVVGMNTAASRYLGVTREEAQGQELNALISAKADAETADKLSRLLVPYETVGGQRGTFVVAQSEDAGGLDALEQLSQGPTWHYRTADEVLTLSQEALEALDTPRLKASGTMSDFLAIFHTDDRDAIRYGFENAMDQAIPFTVLARLKSRGSTSSRVTVTGKVVRAEDGTIEAVEGTLGRLPQPSPQPVDAER
ncbi:MAG: chemotaxis protein CheB [Pseudomonadota bacterium]